MFEEFYFFIPLIIFIFSFILNLSSLSDDRAMYIKDNRKVKWIKIHQFWDRKQNINIYIIIVILIILILLLVGIILNILIFENVIITNILYGIAGLSCGSLVMMPMIILYIIFNNVKNRKREKNGFCKVYRLEKYLTAYSRPKFDDIEKDLIQYFKRNRIECNITHKDIPDHYPFKMIVEFPNENIILSINRIAYNVSKNYRLLMNPINEGAPSNYKLISDHLDDLLN